MPCCSPRIRYRTACPDRSRSRDPLGPGGSRDGVAARFRVTSPARVAGVWGSNSTSWRPKSTRPGFPKAPAACGEGGAFQGGASGWGLSDRGGGGYNRGPRGQGHGKPGHPEAQAMLRRIGGCHEVVHGLAIGSWDGSPEIRSVVDVAEVTMLAMTDEGDRLVRRHRRATGQGRGLCAPGLGGCSSAASWVAHSP